MYITLLNTEFVPIAILDYYESLIWTDRYREAGDFEMYFKMNTSTYTLIQQNFYLINTDSEHVMIIEKKEIISDIENGDRLLIRGRSLESIVERRVVWKQTNFDSTKGDTLHNGIKKLLQDAFGNQTDPTLAKRKLENFRFVESTDPVLLGLTLTAQYTGESIYEILVDLCQDVGIGFKIGLDVNNNFCFMLYLGADRSTNQTENPQIIFSTYFDNIFNSDYLEDYEPYRNVALIAGEGEGKDQKTAFSWGKEKTEPEGLFRRELYVDAKDISSNTEEKTLSNLEYTNALKQRGQEKLSENKISRTFDGEVDSDGMFVLNRDFFLGDIVQFIDAYGNNRSVRVEEYIISDDTSELKFYPSFTVIDSE